MASGSPAFFFHPVQHNLYRCSAVDKAGGMKECCGLEGDFAAGEEDGTEGGEGGRLAGERFGLSSWPLRLLPFFSFFNMSSAI